MPRQAHNVPPEFEPTPGYETGHPQPNQMPDSYGTQARGDWTSTDIQERTLIDVGRSEFLWRCAFQGENLLLDVVYGTRATTRITGVRLPFVGFFPGQLTVTARKLNADLPATALPSLTVSTGGVSVVRSLQVALAALPQGIHRVQSLAAATVTVAGTAVVLVAGQSLDVVAPSSLTAGGPLLLEWSL